MKRFDKERHLDLVQLTNLFEEHRQNHVLMQMPGKMQRPHLGERTAYYFSLEEALQARELFHCIELAKNVDPGDIWDDGHAVVAMAINPDAVLTPFCSQ